VRVASGDFDVMESTAGKVARVWLLRAGELEKSARLGVQAASAAIGHASDGT